MNPAAADPLKVLHLIGRWPDALAARILASLHLQAPLLTPTIHLYYSEQLHKSRDISADLRKVVRNVCVESSDDRRTSGQCHATALSVFADSLVS